MGRDRRAGDPHDLRTLRREKARAKGRGQRRHRSRRRESTQTGRFISQGFHDNGKGWYRRDGLVRCWLTPTPDGGLSLRASVGGLLGTVQIGLESRLNRWQRLAGLQDVQVGDPAFDALAKLEGAPEVIIALLRDDTRRLLSKHLPLGLTIDGDDLRMRWSSKVPRRSLSQEVSEIWRLACRLSLRRERLTARLRSNAIKGRTEGHALKAYSLFMAAERPGKHRRLSGLSKARVPAVRLAYARTLGAEGHSILERLVAYTDVATAIRHEALSVLKAADAMPVEGLLSLENVGEKPLRSLVCAAVLPVVQRAPELLADCSEDVLWLLLDQGSELQLRVLQRLGEQGTERSLPEVVALTRGLFVRSATKEAAKHAQTRILERTRGVVAGGLSLLSGPRRGALTLEAEYADDEDPDVGG